MKEKYSLTDLHCHILPGIDDGASNEEKALQLLKTEYDSGIRQIALTSHFDCEDLSLDTFLELRMKAYERLMQEIKNSEMEWEDLKLKLGAEVYFSPNLCHLDVKKLCMEGTTFLLLELPVERLPAYFNETIYQIQACGVTPIIAHVERYQYVMHNPVILCDWIDSGIYTQMNAGTLLRYGKNSKIYFNMLKWRLVNVLASDTHSMSRRPPNLLNATKKIDKQLGYQMTDEIFQNADLIFNGIHPEIVTIHCPRKIMGRWR